MEEKECGRCGEVLSMYEFREQSPYCATCFWIARGERQLMMVVSLALAGSFLLFLLSYIVMEVLT